MKPYLIGLCVMGRPKSTGDCLSALYEHTDHHKYDLKILGQNPTPEVMDVLKIMVSEDEYVHQDFNSGIVFGHNKLMSYRKPGQHYIKIDDDCIVETPDWLDLFDRVLAHEEIGSCLGRRPTFWIDAPGRFSYYYEEVPVKELEPDLWIEEAREGGCVGCWWGLKGEVLDYIGPFNEATCIDDLDWNIRASSLGYKTVYIPDVVIKQPQEQFEHPQSRANKVIVPMNIGLHEMYLDEYKRGKIQLGTRFKDTVLNTLYKTYSDKNWEFFKNFKNEDWL